MAVIDFAKRLILACVGLAVLIGALMASFVLGIALLVAIAMLWVYLRLRQAKVIRTPGDASFHAQDPQVIEADYVVVEETETREPEDRA